MNHAAALEAVERILNRGGQPEDVLIDVLEALHVRGVGYAAIRFGGRELAVGAPRDGIESPIVVDGMQTGTFVLGTDDPTFVARVATLISPYVR